MPVPPGIPSTGSTTAAAGDNEITIHVPDSQDWELQAVAALNSTTVVRINIFIEQAGNRSLIFSGAQQTISDWQFAYFDDMTVLWSQAIVFQFIGCALNDVLSYNYLAKVYKRGELK